MEKEHLRDGRTWLGVRDRWWGVNDRPKKLPYFNIKKV
jgi:hypothetical protein